MKFLKFTTKVSILPNCLNFRQHSLNLDTLRKFTSIRKPHASGLNRVATVSVNNDSLRPKLMIVFLKLAKDPSFKHLSVTIFSVPKVTPTWELEVLGTTS